VASLYWVSSVEIYFKGTGGARITGLLGQLPTVLALDRAEKSLQISERLPTRLGTKKTGSDPLGHLLSRNSPRDRIRRGRMCRRAKSDRNPIGHSRNVVRVNFFL
jgi:hypothetical protein